jgi:predicted Zn finger-like uncharacterized protein
MIIECKTCHARFRLDESKIKGKGARVKCRKCGDAIIVLKDAGSGAVSREPGGEGSLDLGSALRESSGEVSPFPGTPRPDNLIPFPGPARPVEAPAVSGKDEVDIAFDHLLAGPGEPPAPEPPPTPAMEQPLEPPAETAQAPEPDLTAPEERAVPSAEPDTIPWEAPEEGAVPPEAPVPSAAGEPSPWTVGEGTLEFSPEEKVEIPPRAEGGFIISDSETLDFLQEERRDREGAQGADISSSIASAPVEPVTSPPLESTAFAAPAPEASPVSAEEEIPIEGNVTPPPALHGTEVPPYREDEPASAPPVFAAPPPFREPAAIPAARRSTSSPALVAGVVLLAIVLAAVGFFGFTASGRKTIESVTPRIAALWGGKGAGKAVSRYEVKNVIGYYDSGAASTRILVIKGQVTNLSSTGKSGIRVAAALLDNTDKVLMQQVVYAGNVVSGARVKTEDRETLAKVLANPLGDHLANMDVLPGKTIPFMVLFFDAPEEIDSYRLEAKDTE